MAQQQQSSVGLAVFRELSGEEQAVVDAHTIEQSLIDWLATGEFRDQVIQWLTKTGRYGAGACYPVVYFKGTLQFKVFASVESARSNERMPPPYTLNIEGEAGERKPDTEQIAEGETTVSRVIGASTENAVDKIRLEAGLVPLVPTRSDTGGVVNKPGKHAQRKADYDARFEKSKQTVLDKKAAEAAAKQTEEERLRAAAESEARSQEPTTDSGANLK